MKLFFQVVKCLKEVNQIKSNQVWHVVFFIWLCFFTYDLNKIIYTRVRLICLSLVFFSCGLIVLRVILVWSFLRVFSPNSLFYFYYFLFGISYTYYFPIIFFIIHLRKNISCAKKWGGGGQPLDATCDVE